MKTKNSIVKNLISTLGLGLSLSIASITVQAASSQETAILSGGCFWGMEEVFRKIPGVTSTEVGYTGGSTKNPSYGEVSSGSTGHAESIRIHFDPKVITYQQVLNYFFRAHNPTTLNSQGNDQGTQYRSDIFYSNETQHQIAIQMKDRVEKSGKWGEPIVTRIDPAASFYRAEEHHQKYLVNNPNGYNDHYLRNFDFLK